LTEGKLYGIKELPWDLERTCFDTEARPRLRRGDKLPTGRVNMRKLVDPAVEEDAGLLLQLLSSGDKASAAMFLDAMTDSDKLQLSRQLERTGMPVYSTVIRLSLADRRLRNRVLEQLAGRLDDVALAGAARIALGLVHLPLSV